MQPEAKNTYSEEQIKKAYYAKFHKTGELWFPYPDMGASEEKCEAVTQQSFSEFLEELKKAAE